MWSGDSLWYDRWQQIWTVQPEFVEIISWNDYGESHYIGPLVSSKLVPVGFCCFGSQNSFWARDESQRSVLSQYTIWLT